jgi:hypothetical protein
MNKKSHNAVLWKELSITASVLILLFILFFRGSIGQFPSHTHAWTQSDRYALSLGFVDNGLDLFHPATYNLQRKYQPNEPLQEEKGITRVDLPLPDYLAAIVMTVSGNKDPVVFRSIILIMGFIGLMFVFALLRNMGTDFVTSLFSTIFVFSSPVYTYYLDGFIPSVPALSLACIAFFFYWRYLKSNHFRDFILTIGLLTLAALIRMPFIMLFAVIAATQVLFNLRNKSLLIKESLVILFFFSIFSAYFTYNQYLGKVYGSMVIEQLLPARSLEELKTIINQTLKNWKLVYFSVFQYLVMVIAMAGYVVAIFRKKLIDTAVQRFLVVLVMALFADLAYFVAMARQFPAHDYYMLDSGFLPVLFLTLIGLSVIKFSQKRLFIFGRYLIQLILICIMIYSSYKIQNERYTSKSWDRVEITTANFSDSKMLCEQAGIASGERVLVIDAYTTNIPLILINHKGYTVLNTSSSEINESLNFNFDFIAIQNRFLSSDVLRNAPRLRSQLLPIANNGKIGLYRLTDNSKVKSYTELMGLEHQNRIFSMVKYQGPDLNTMPMNTNFLLVDTVMSLPVTDSLVLVFECKASLMGENKGGLHFVMDLSNNIDNQNFKYYDSFTLDPFFEHGTKQAKIEVILRIPNIEQKNVRYKCYIWNNGSNDLIYNDMKLQIVQYLKHTF